nr:MAG TPA: hypothetical protein [Microviridae sp.]
MALTTKQFYSSFSRVGFSIWKSLPSPEYDDIVDKTDFRPDSEVVRGSTISSVPAMKGIYDYDDGEVTDDKRPSDVIMALREGRLDKADLPAIESQLKQEIQRENDELQRKADEAALASISKARQNYLDSLTGFDKNSVPNEQGQNTGGQ